MTCKQAKHFQYIFPNGTVFKPALDDLVFSEKIDSFKIKSAIWKFYLQIFPKVGSISSTQQEWVSIIDENRKKYEEIKERYLVEPEKNRIESKDDDSLGPLGADDSSEWGQYFKDNKLKELIELDTNRLFQDIPFFTDKEILKHIYEIIFLHIRYFEKYEYCQGFHELCGVIYYLFSNEMKSALNDDKKDPNYGYSFIFCRDFIDADTFWTYASLIDFVFEFYDNKKDPKKSVSLCAQKCIEVTDILVGKISSELSDKINFNDASLRLISWFRPLYARQFPLDDILVVWTKIFAYYPDSTFISHIAVAMIMSCKDEFMSFEDTTDILLKFSKFFVLSSPNLIIHEAIFRMSEKQEEKPTDDTNDNYSYSNACWEKMRALSESTCGEVEKMLHSICVLPKEDIITTLEKFRDSLKIIANTDKDIDNDEELNGLKSMPSYDIIPKIETRSSFQIDTLEEEMSPLALLPKATKTDDSRKSKDKISLFDEEVEASHHGSRKKVADLFSNGNKKNELFI